MLIKTDFFAKKQSNKECSDGLSCIENIKRVFIMLIQVVILHIELFIIEIGKLSL